MAAIGTPADMLARLQQLLPAGWFQNGQVPLRDALLTGIANGYAFIYSLFSYVRLQTRVASATDGFLDLIAQDFFGGSLLRRAGQTDASFRANIQANMFRARGTRAAVSAVVQQLTTQAPIIFEPEYPPDTGAYTNGTCAYGVAGGYGDMNLNCQSFVTAFAGGGVGIPNVAGYGISTGAYSTPSQAAYEDPSANQITPADIFNAINSVRPASYLIWAKVVA